MTIGNGMEPTLPAARWLTVFVAATNLYFHLTTAYDILRARGAPLGKIDMFMPDGLDATHCDAFATADLNYVAALGVRQRGLC